MVKSSNAEAGFFQLITRKGGSLLLAAALPATLLFAGAANAQTTTLSCLKNEELLFSTLRIALDTITCTNDCPAGTPEAGIEHKCQKDDWGVSIPLLGRFITKVQCNCHLYVNGVHYGYSKPVTTPVVVEGSSASPVLLQLEELGYSDLDVTLLQSTQCP